MEIADTDTIQLPTQTYSSKIKRQLPQSFDSSATLVVSAIQYHDHLKEQHNTLYPNQQEQDPEIQQSNKSSLKQRFFSIVTRGKNGKRQQKKRRQLLWQWSVAMGYCKYHHGQHLDTIIDRLVEKQNSSRHFTDNDTQI
jgi:hypothetical protein